MDDELTVEQAAKLSGYSEAHIRRLAGKGKVASRRVGRRMFLIEAESLKRYVDRMESMGGDKHGLRYEPK